MLKNAWTITIAHIVLCIDSGRRVRNADAMTTVGSINGTIINALSNLLPLKSHRERKYVGPIATIKVAKVLSDACNNVNLKIFRIEASSNSEMAEFQFKTFVERFRTGQIKKSEMKIPGTRNKTVLNHLGKDKGEMFCFSVERFESTIQSTFHCLLR